jgi:glycerate kinase
MRIVVAPDSFKGTLTQREAVEAIMKGLGRERPGWTLVARPMADGGEGTVDVLAVALGGAWVSATVEDAFGRPRTARFLMLTDGTAVVEAASGPGFIPAAARPAPGRQAHSRGLGQLMQAALAAEARRLVVTLGGTGCSDGGMGLLQALGATWDPPLPPGAEALAQVRRVTLPRLAVPVEAWADVLPPLLGPAGAIRRYGPQKGLDPTEIDWLEAGMAHWGRVLEEASGIAVIARAGAGAAGGAGAALAALGAPIRSGGMAVAAAVGLPEALSTADAVVTGEGQADAQSAAGKVVAVVGRLAKAAHRPAFVVAGRLGPGATRLYALGLSGLFAVSPGAGSPAAALEARVRQIVPWLDPLGVQRYGGFREGVR